MSDYVLSIASYKALNEEVILDILKYRSIQDIVFPANLPVAPNKTITLTSAKDFSLNLIPKSLKNDFSINIPLFSEDNIKFTISIYFRKTNAPNIITIEFSDKEIKNRYIDVEKIKNILNDVVPTFGVYDGILYDKYLQKIYRPDGGFGFNRIKKIKNIRLEIGWINFFGKEIVEILGKKRFDNLKSCNEKYDLHAGVIVVLQKEPFDKQNPEHLYRKKIVEQELGFNKLGDIVDI